MNPRNKQAGIALVIVLWFSVLLAVVLFIGLATYAIRGIFWATLDSCEIPIRIKGLAIGVISLIGYTPDVFMGPLSGFLLDRAPGATGHQHLFAMVAGFALVGLVASLAVPRSASMATSDEGCVEH